MTQETDRAVLVQRILSKECVHCGMALSSDNSCDTCTRSILTAKVENLKETLNGKLEQVKNIMDDNASKLDDINILVEQIKRLNRINNKG